MCYNEEITITINRATVEAILDALVSELDKNKYCKKALESMLSEANAEKIKLAAELDLLKGGAVDG